MNLAPFLKGVHPHSETYTKVSYAAQSSPLRFGSCFTEDRFTRLLRNAPERSSTQADTAELAARLSRFFAAFQSRSASNPHCEQRNSRCDNASSALSEPQQEQVLLDGNHLSATATDAP